MKRPLATAGVAALIAACGATTGPLLSPTGAWAQAKEVRVYSGRHYSSDDALYEQFSKATGIKVRLLESNDSTILERLRNEGNNSSADVLILVDAAKLDQATDLGLFQAVGSGPLMRDVPLSLRDPKGRWYGLTRRVRAFVVNPSIVQPSQLRTYADLAKPALKGKLCLRNRNNVYNQSLVADQLILRGEAATAQWIRGMVANLAEPVFTSDTTLARAVGKGQCGVGLANSYYVARMIAGQNGAADKALARQLRIVYPTPAHVNVSGAGVTRYAKNRSEAIRLIEFLTSPSGAQGFAKGSLEYPLKGYGDSPILKRFGPFKPDGLSAAQLGAKNKAAVALMAANGWK
ncbi:MAG: extracellular solute-binding protein [Cyanobacteriota bacterium]|nr:extracellular solute-binding protein [Cyanobacteriota bacterium]